MLQTFTLRFKFHVLIFPSSFFFLTNPQPECESTFFFFFPWRAAKDALRQNQHRSSR